MFTPNSIKMIKKNMEMNILELEFLIKRFGCGNQHFSKKIEALLWKLKNEETLKEIIEIEKELLVLHNTFRKSWLEHAFFHSVDKYKSPELGSLLDTPLGTKIDFKYERALSLEKFEIKKYKQIENTKGFSLFFSSAMAAMTTLIHSLSKINSKNHLNSIYYGSYFEIETLLSTFNHRLNFINVNSQNEMLLHLEKHSIDLLIIEPVKYNFSLEVLNINQVIEVLNSHPPKKTFYLVIDSTLMGSTFKLEEIYKKIESDNIIVVEIRSGLKLDQGGLEFSNIGLLSCYTSEKYFEFNSRLNYYLTRVRSLMGTNLSYLEICILDNYIFLEHSQKYALEILNNNKCFAQAIEFKKSTRVRVIHPSIQYNGQENSEAPFIFIKLIKGTKKEYEALFEEIIKRINNNNLNILKGNSFGFLHTRIELITLANEEKDTILKIAVGKIKGPSYYCLLDILNNLDYSFGKSELLTLIE